MEANISFTYGQGEWGKPTIIRGEGDTIFACKRRPIKKLMHLIPYKWIEYLEQNQQVPSCCRHPENNDIEAWHSSLEDYLLGIVDRYDVYCNTCGRRQRIFRPSGGPKWICDQPPFDNKKVLDQLVEALG